MFGGIENKNVKMPYWKDPVYTEKQLATKTIVVPLKDIRLLYVDFLTPELTKTYKSAVIITVNYSNKLKFNVNYFN